MLKYRCVKNKIKTGDIYFTNNPTLFSKIICLVTKSKVSHVGIFVWLADRLFIVESKEFSGCRMMLASQYFKQCNIVDIRRVPDVKVSETELIRDVGNVKYDMIGAILSPFVDTKSDERFCSEFVADKLNLKGKINNNHRGIYPCDIQDVTTQIL